MSSSCPPEFDLLISRRLLRHGRSRANERGIIVSSLVSLRQSSLAEVQSQCKRWAEILCVREEGKKEEYGLIELGHEQATSAGYICIQCAAFHYISPVVHLTFNHGPAHVPDAQQHLASKCRVQWQETLGEWKLSDLRVCSSPFSRAKQTAADAAAAVDIKPSRIEVMHECCPERPAPRRFISYTCVYLRALLGA